MKCLALVSSCLLSILAIICTSTDTYAAGPVLIGGERVRTAAQVRALNISWYYNYTPAATASGAEFVPMIRDESQLSRLNELAGTTGWVLGFNECGVENQATSLNTPLKIARAWRRVEQALPDAQLVSPSFVDQNSLPWAVGDYPTFAEFVAAYRAEYGESPRIDAISIHTYGWCRNRQHDAARMAEYVTARHEEAVALGYDVPIWVTEFGLIPWPGQTYTTEDTQLLQRKFLSWAVAQPWIARIAWFPSVPAPDWPDTLTQGDQLTPLGQQYAALNAQLVLASPTPQGRLALRNR
jgi:hypothetical protein